MSNIYSLGQTCPYMITRAARHRRAGRYDKAMTLLAKAKSEFGGSEELEFELARTYDEMGCEDEACRAYLRVVRRGGALASQALFHLSLSSAEQADLTRAVAYFEAFLASGGDGVAAESAQLLQRQLLDALQKPPAKTRRQRAKALEQRSIERLNAGKIHAAKRTVARSLAMHETSQGHVLKACCYLIAGEGQEAISEAKAALEDRPRYLQALCVLADAYIMTGNKALAKKTLVFAAFHAHTSDALLSVAIECAKHGFDEMTLILTRRLIKRDPFHVRALAMRACAFVNLGGRRQAKRIFARLSALLPEDSVFDAYYCALEEERPFSGRLTLAQDVTEEEAIARSLRLIEILNEDPESVRQNAAQIEEICRLARWALRSPMAGANITFMAIVALSVVGTQRTQEVLYDALTDPQIDDALKSSILQAVSTHCEQMPRYVDMDGRLVRLAAGASIPTIRGAGECQAVVQRAAQVLLPSYPDAADVLLGLWVAYLNKYGAVRGRMANACSAALEYTYHLCAGRKVEMKPIAQRMGTSRRLAMLCVRRMCSAYGELDEERDSD